MVFYWATGAVDAVICCCCFFLFLRLGNGFNFSRKAHIRDQRWMSYLFAHQIIGNFAFHRVTVLALVPMFVSHFVIIRRQCIVRQSRNLLRKQHDHFRLVTIELVGETRWRVQLTPSVAAFSSCAFHHKHTYTHSKHIHTHHSIKQWPNACYLIYIFFLNLHLLIKLQWRRERRRWCRWRKKAQAAKQILIFYCFILCFWFNSPVQSFGTYFGCPVSFVAFWVCTQSLMLLTFFCLACSEWLSVQLQKGMWLQQKSD